MSGDEAEFDAAELAKRAGVTQRTIYYYAQQGLIPPAAGTGRGPKYGRGHLLRLRLIKRLQQQHLPLAEIASRIKALNDVDVATLLEEDTPSRPRGGSALEYVRSVLAEAPLPSPRDPSMRRLRSHSSNVGPPGQLPASPGTPAGERSQWERITLTDGIELHVRRPMARLQQKSLERLLSAGRQIFIEEQS
jgi:DNA-binding transcriptional MerR regulator